MPRPRFQKLDGERQLEILGRAALEFAGFGFEGASLNRVLDEVGLSKGGFYYLFDDKADLFVSVLRHMEQIVIEEADFHVEGLEADTFWDRLRDLVRASVRLLASYPWSIGLGRAVHSLSPDSLAHPAIAAWLADHLALLENVVKRGQALGVMRGDLPATLLARMVFTVDEIMDRWALEHWDEMSETDVEAYLDIALSVIRGMTSPPKEMTR